MREVELLARTRVQGEDRGAGTEGDRTVEGFVGGDGGRAKDGEVGAVDAELGGAEAVAYGRPGVVQDERSLIE